MVNKGREHWKFKRAWAYLHEVTIDPGLGRPGRAVHIGNVDGRWGHCACYPWIPRGGAASPSGRTRWAGYVLPLVFEAGVYTGK